MKAELGQVIAERRLKDLDHPDVVVVVRMGLPLPYPDAPHPDYYCPYQITGVGDEKVRYSMGVDSLQALELALLLLPTQLAVLAKKHPGLRWETEEAGNFAFTPTVMSYPPIPRSGEAE